MVPNLAKRLRRIRIRYLIQLVFVLVLINGGFTIAALPDRGPGWPYWVVVTAVLIGGVFSLRFFEKYLDEARPPQCAPKSTRETELAKARRDVRRKNQQFRAKEIDNATAVILIGGVTTIVAAHLLVRDMDFVAQLVAVALINGGLAVRTVCHRVLAELAALELDDAESGLEVLAFQSRQVSLDRNETNNPQTLDQG